MIAQAYRKLKHMSICEPVKYAKKIRNPFRKKLSQIWYFRNNEERLNVEKTKSQENNLIFSPLILTVEIYNF